MEEVFLDLVWGYLGRCIIEFWSLDFFKFKKFLLSDRMEFKIFLRLIMEKWIFGVSMGEGCFFGVL